LILKKGVWILLYLGATMTKITFFFVNKGPWFDRLAHQLIGKCGTFCPVSNDQLALKCCSDLQLKSIVSWMNLNGTWKGFGVQ